MIKLQTLRARENQQFEKKMTNNHKKLATERLKLNQNQHFFLSCFNEMKQQGLSVKQNYLESRQKGELERKKMTDLQGEN